MNDRQRPSAAAADDQVVPVVEAVLFASDSPLTAAKIAQAAELQGIRSVKQAIEVLNARYEEAGSAFRIEEIAGGYQMLTLPKYHETLCRVLSARDETRLSQAALETLSIVAYRQPILRADIEAIRGVSCGEVLRGLMEKQLVKIVGRAEVLGRPMLYGTTRRFLEIFGLSGLDDLPKAAELRQPADRKTTGSPPRPPTPDQEPPQAENAPAQEQLDADAQSSADKRPRV